MKTNLINQIGLGSRSAQLNSVKPDNRLPIDTEARKKNRTLPTAKVLELLKTSSPGLFNLAEVVGKWVWVSFRETPAPELRQILAQLGFHWNRERQAEQTCPALRGRRITPHTWRHSTAMHLLQAGVPLEVIALWLGHEQPAVTHSVRMPARSHQWASAAQALAAG
jgi:integrase